MMMKVTCTALTALLAVVFMSSDQEVEARLGGGGRSGSKRLLQVDDSGLPMLEIIGNNGKFDSYPLGPCQGDCDSNDDCAPGLYCYQREAFEAVPGCQDDARGNGFNTRGDYCIPIAGLEEDEMMPMMGTDSPSIGVTLGVTAMVEGEEDPLMIATDVETEDVETDFEMMDNNSSKTETPSEMINETVTMEEMLDIEIVKQAAQSDPPKPSEADDNDMEDEELGQLWVRGNNGIPGSVFPLKNCEGDCDSNEECGEGLICWIRASGEEVPGCVGGLLSRTDFCVKEKYATAAADDGANATSVPVDVEEDDEEDMTTTTVQTDAPVSVMAEDDDEMELTSTAVVVESGTETPSLEVTAVPEDIDDGTVPPTEDIDVEILKQAAQSDPPKPPGVNADNMEEELGQLQVPGNNGLPASVFPLKNCQGDCDSNEDCGEGLICWMREYGEEVPGCAGGLLSRTDFCVKEKYATGTDDGSDATIIATSVPVDVEEEDGMTTITVTDAPVGVTIEDDDEMELTSTAVVVESGTETPSLEVTAVPEDIDDGTVPPTEDIDVEILKQAAQSDPPKPSGANADNMEEELGQIQVPGNNGLPASVFPLKNCQGDCDSNEDCGEGLICWMREYGEEVPGCAGGLLSRTDFCVKEKYATGTDDGSDAIIIATSVPVDVEEEDDMTTITVTDAPVGVTTEDDDEMALTATAVVVETGTGAPSLEVTAVSEDIDDGTVPPTEDIDVEILKNLS